MHLQVWQPQHDKKLLFGVLKHGWDQWLLILKDPLLDLERFVRQELYLTPTQPQQLPSVTNDKSAASPQLPSQAAPLELTTPAVAALTTSAAAEVPAAAAVAVGAVVGPRDKPAAASEPASSSAPSKAEGGFGGVPGQPTSQPDSTRAGDDKGKNSFQGIKLEPATSAQPTAGDAPVTDAAGKLKVLLGGIQVKEPKPASADPPPTFSVPALEMKEPPAGIKLEPAAAAVSAPDMAGPSNGVKLEPAAAAVSAPQIAGPSHSIKLEPAAAAASNSQQPAGAATGSPNESASATVQPQNTVPQPPPLAASDVVDLTAPEMPSTSTAGGPAVTATQSAVPASDASGAATSTAAEPKLLTAPPSIAAAVSTAQPSSQTPAVLGCPKCRWAPKGCAVCRAKWQAAGNALPPTLTASGSGNVDTSAAAAARAERTIATRLCNWLLARTNVLASVLKGTHKVGPGIADPPEPRMPATVAPARHAGAVVTTSSGPRPPGPAIAPGAAVVTGANLQTVVGTPAYPGQWQQNAVQMSQFRQQQRQLQQQQLAAAQEQQRQSLLLQRQQLQHHTSLLRQQHQSAQLQQQQQQAAKVQAQALQQQQLCMRQQQQQQALRQQQLNRQNELQLQRQQQLLLQQQRQRSSQLQVQRALTSQGSQPSTSLQPAGAHVSATQRAQQQQQKPTAPQGQISHPLSEWLASTAFRPCSVYEFCSLAPCP